MRWRPVVPFLVACLLSFVWLNQGVSKAHKEAIVAADAAAPAKPRAPWLRNALLDLYEQANDQEIYFAVASAIRGLPYSQDRLSYRGAIATPAFSLAPPADGRWHVPYVEVPIEYPVAMLPFVLLPRFVSGGDFEDYAHVFSAFMAALLLFAAALAIRAQPGRDTTERWWAMVALLAAQGSLAVQRLDAVIALLLALTVWAAAERRTFTAGVGLGLSTATKFLPVLLAPLLCVADRATWRLPAARKRGALGLVGAATLGLAPMLLMLPNAFEEVIQYHAQRGLQAEASYAVLLSTWQLFAGTAHPATLTYGSYNVDSAAASFFAHASMPITLLLSAALFVRFARAPEPANDIERRDRLALALLAGLSALWLSAKVFSPQYMTWGLPLVLAVSGARGRQLTWLLVAIMIVTQVYLRGYYGQVVLQTPIGVGTLLLRLGLLVVFAARVLAREQPARVTIAKSALA